MSADHAMTALCRFGMGAAPGQATNIGNDPRGWVAEQLDRPVKPLEFSRLESGATLVRRQLVQTQKADKAKGDKQRVYLLEADARTRAAITSPTPFIERLVRFWSNHFTVSTARGSVTALVGAFEREAIRPHVTGRFSDMLAAVMHHPAMLGYLDNVRSIGPNSVVGERKERGLNENLARELLELHTLGVDGGYAQFDVEALARILTGWTILPKTGAFHFAAQRHEPGDKVLLGHPIKAGLAGGEQALVELARHHATAHHLATKLARHFIADDPPSAVIEGVARTFLESDGDLKAVSAALVLRPEPWATPLAKIRSPDDLVIATARALGPELLAAPKSGPSLLVKSLRVLGQAPWSAPSPAGWPDRGEAWLGPDTLMRRLEWASAVAKRAKNIPPSPLVDQCIDASPQTRKILTEAPISEQIFLMLASSEFQRR